MLGIGKRLRKSSLLGCFLASEVGALSQLELFSIALLLSPSYGVLLLSKPHCSCPRHPGFGYSNPTNSSLGCFEVFVSVPSSVSVYFLTQASTRELCSSVRNTFCVSPLPVGAKSCPSGRGIGMGNGED